MLLNERKAQQMQAVMIPFVSSCVVEATRNLASQLEVEVKLVQVNLLELLKAFNIDSFVSSRRIMVRKPCFQLLHLKYICAD